MAPANDKPGPSPRRNGGGQMHFDDLWTASGAPAPGAPEGVARSSAVARRLAQAREAAGFETSSAAALAFGWSPARYLAHESGDRPVAPKQLALYAEAFGVTVLWLQTGEGIQKIVADALPRSTAAGAPRAAAIAPIARAQAAPSEAMLRAARDAVFRLAVERGLIPAAVPWDQTLAVAETWREIADAAVNAAWTAKG